jgi:hypothetical protein
MTIDPVPFQNPNQSTITLPRIQNPYLSVWWTSQTVSDVPENVMGWLVAQGFEVTGIRQDNTTTPPTNYFSVARQGLQPWQVLLSMCNSYTIQANTARDANTIRYNQIVSNWTEMIDTSQEQFEAQIDEQNTQAGVFFADLDQYMTEIETLIDNNRSQIVTDAANANTAIGEMNSRLTDLETNAQDANTTISGLLSDQETYLNTFLNDFSAKLDELDANYTSHLATILSEVADLDVILADHIADYSNQFATLQANYAAHETDLEKLLAEATNNTNTIVNDIGSILRDLELDYADVSADLDAIRVSAGNLVTAHAADYNQVLALLETDYNTHAPITINYLLNLGATELARINEQFAANLAEQLQGLTNRGLYTSALVADITARNHRDRDEQIQMLNDRLMREKWENQHRIYEQQVSMRDRTLSGKDRIHSVQQEVLRYQASLISGTYALLQETRNRILAGKQAIFSAKDANTRLGIDVQSGLYSKIQEVRQRIIESLDRIYQLRDVFAKWENTQSQQLYSQIQQIETQQLSGIEQQHSSKQEVSRTEMNQRNLFLQQIQDALRGLLTGKERYSAVLMSNASTLAEHKHRAIAERMNTAVQRLDGWHRISDQNRQLMAYQLDERNKLLVGLYSFVEKRDDIAPEWKDMASMIAGLGDSAGGWLTP